MNSTFKTWQAVIACAFFLFLAAPALAETHGPFLYSSMPVNVTDVVEANYFYENGNMFYSLNNYPNTAEKQYVLLLATTLDNGFSFKDKKTYGNYTVFSMENADGDEWYIVDPACNAPYGLMFYKSPYESVVEEFAQSLCSETAPPGKVVMFHLSMAIISEINETKFKLVEGEPIVSELAIKNESGKPYTIKIPNMTSEMSNTYRPPSYARVVEVKSSYYSSNKYLEDYTFDEKFDGGAFTYSSYNLPEGSVWQHIYHYGGGSNYDLYIYTNVSNAVVEDFLGRYLAAAEPPPEPAAGISEGGMLILGTLMSVPLVLAVLWLASLVLLLIRDRASKGILASKPFLRIKSHTALFISLSIVLMSYFFALLISMFLFLILVAIPIIIAANRDKLGIPLKKSDAPQLFRMLEDISKRMGVNLPHIVLLTPDSSIGIVGMFKRELHIGMGGLQKLSADELYAILVHEFAHFKGRDNIIGSLLMYLGSTLDKIISFFHYAPTIYALVIEIVLRFYAFFYGLATFTYSRQREYLADLWAAKLAGGRNYANTLKKYGLEHFYFTILAPSAIANAAVQGKRFKNIYAAHKKFVAAAKPADRRKFEQKVKELDRDSMFSSHPSDKRRFAMIQGIKSEKAPHFRGSAIGMIKGLPKKQVELTRLYTDFIIKKIKK